MEHLDATDRRILSVLQKDGRISNADLAARLYIAPKTAAVHVSNVLAKLGMSSRNEVAAWARNEGSFASPDLG